MNKIKSALFMPAVSLVRRTHGQGFHIDNSSALPAEGVAYQGDVKNLGKKSASHGQRDGFPLRKSASPNRRAFKIIETI